jgi:hypothetical protein
MARLKACPSVAFLQEAICSGAMGTTCYLAVWWCAEAELYLGLRPRVVCFRAFGPWGVVRGLVWVEMDWPGQEREADSS